MGIWIPMYASTAGSPEYTKLIQSVEGDKCLANSFHGTVLTGPRSGPPSPADAAEDKQFRDAFALVASTNQWTAFGYVTTRYMKRPLDEVLRDIDTVREQSRSIAVHHCLQREHDWWDRCTEKHVLLIDG